MSHFQTLPIQYSWWRVQWRLIKEASPLNSVILFSKFLQHQPIIAGVLSLTNPTIFPPRQFVFSKESPDQKKNSWAYSCCLHYIFIHVLIFCRWFYVLCCNLCNSKACMICFIWFSSSSSKYILLQIKFDFLQYAFSYLQF